MCRNNRMMPDVGQRRGVAQRHQVIVCRGSTPIGTSPSPTPCSVTLVANASIKRALASLGKLFPRLASTASGLNEGDRFELETEPFGGALALREIGGVPKHGDRAEPVAGQRQRTRAP